MRGFAFLGLVASACGTAEGVYIEVRVPPTVQASAVDLYLGERCESIGDEGCNSMTPPRIANNTTRDEIDGEVYFADSPVIFTSPVEDGIATFYLAPGNSKVEAAIAVAHQPDLGNTGVALLRPIKLAETRRLIVDLDPIEDNFLLGKDRSLEIWETPDRSRRCVGVDFDGRRVFVVPTDDADCDQVPSSSMNTECAPTVHLSVEAASSELPEQSCTILDPDEICLLGDRACDETSEVRGSCQPGAVKYCVPSALCACETFDDACLMSLVDDDPAALPDTTRIECTIEYEKPSGGNVFQTCQDKGLNDISLGDVCAAVQIAPLARDSLDGFGATLTIPDPAGDIEITPTISSPCLLNVGPPNAVFRNGEPSSEVHHLLLKIDANPTAPGARQVLMPLDIQLVPLTLPGDCAVGTRTRCELIADPVTEHVTRCLELR